MPDVSEILSHVRDVIDLLQLATKRQSSTRRKRKGQGCYNHGSTKRSPKHPQKDSETLGCLVFAGIIELMLQVSTGLVSLCLEVGGAEERGVFFNKETSCDILAGCVLPYFVLSPLYPDCCSHRPHGNFHQEKRPNGTKEQ